VKALKQCTTASHHSSLISWNIF